MKNTVIYEWSVELVDECGDILSVSFADKFHELDLSHEKGLTPRIALLRRVGNEEDMETERGYAYKGDEKFDSHHAIPKYLKKQLDRL